MSFSTLPTTGGAAVMLRGRTVKEALEGRGRALRAYATDKIKCLACF